jgi:hypothetical protein
MTQPLATAYNGYACKSITFNNRFAYCTVKQTDIDTGGSGTTLNSGWSRLT